MAIGNSLYDEDGAKIVERLVKKASDKNVKLHFPIDFITADKVRPKRGMFQCFIYLVQV